MSENRDADRPPLEFWFRTLCDARAAGGLNAGYLRCAEELYRAALTAQQGWDAEAADARALHAEVERLREELRQARDAAETNRDIAAVLGYEAGQREAERTRDGGAMSAERLSDEAIDGVLNGDMYDQQHVVLALMELQQRRAAEVQARIGAEEAWVRNSGWAVARLPAGCAAEGHYIHRLGFEAGSAAAEAELAGIREAVRTVSREWDQTAGLQHQSPRLWEAFDRLVALASDPARGKDDAP